MLLAIVMFSTNAFACRPLQDPIVQEQTIKDAAFIGIVAVITKYDEPVEGRKTLLAQMKPFFVYKAADDFDLASSFVVTSNGEGWSSCDTRIYPSQTLQEVILFKNDDETYRIGNKTHFALGKFMSDLRNDVEYIQQ